MRKRYQPPASGVSAMNATGDAVASQACGSVAGASPEPGTRSNAATMPSLNEDSLLSFRVPSMSLPEQRTIVETWQSSNDARVTLSGAFASQVALLQEHKQALITAAVTGQLDLARTIAEEAS